MVRVLLLFKGGWGGGGGAGVKQSIPYSNFPDPPKVQIIVVSI